MHYYQAHKPELVHKVKRLCLLLLFDNFSCAYKIIYHLRPDRQAIMCETTNNYIPTHHFVLNSAMESPKNCIFFCFIECSKQNNYYCYSNIIPCSNNLSSFLNIWTLGQINGTQFMQNWWHLTAVFKIQCRKLENKQTNVSLDMGRTVDFFIFVTQVCLAFTPRTLLGSHICDIKVSMK